MTTIEVIKVIRDYGVNAILALCLLWMNSRLDKVENKLFDCIQQRFEEKGKQYYFPPNPMTNRSVGILSEELKIRKG